MHSSCDNHTSSVEVDFLKQFDKLLQAFSSIYKSMMYQTQAEIREARTKRWLYILFGLSILVLAGTCTVLMVLMSVPTNATRVVGPDSAYAVGEVAEEAVDRLRVTESMPGAPNWSEDIIYVIKQPNNTYRAYLGIDPSTGCKINWRAASRTFVDSTCSQTQYSIQGLNQTQAGTLAGGPAHLIELMVLVDENGQVVVHDQQVRRDIR
jgi:hypothetical protein